MRRKFVYLMCFTVCLALVVTSVVVATSSEINSIFQNSRESLEEEDAVADDTIIARTENSEITVGEFRQYKANLDFMQDYSGHQFDQSDVDMLHSMLETALLLEYAEEVGVVIPTDELMMLIGEERKMLAEQEEQEGRDLLHALIKQSGLEEEEYWVSKQTIDDYRNWFTIHTLTEKLFESGEVSTGEGLETFRQLLFENADIFVDEAIVKQIK